MRPLCSPSAEVWPDQAVFVGLAIKDLPCHLSWAEVANKESSYSFGKGRNPLRENDIAWRIP